MLQKPSLHNHSQAPIEFYGVYTHSKTSSKERYQFHPENTRTSLKRRDLKVSSSIHRPLFNFFIGFASRSPEPAELDHFG